MTVNYSPYSWGSSPQYLVNNNGLLFFTANDMINGQELWMSDGTAAGTSLVTDLTGDAGSSHPENLTAIGGRIFMSAMSESMGREPVTVIDIVAPSTPSITAPAATTGLQRPAITWTASTNAVSYDVHIKNNSTGVDPQVSANVAGTSFTPLIDLGIGKYTVWVRAVSASGGKSAWSAPRNFTVNTSAVPAPMLRSQLTSRPAIVWKDLTGAVKYDLWLDSTSPNQTSTIILHDIRGKSWQNATDLPLGQYRAWVRGLDASGLAAGWSSVVYFNVATPPTPTAPVNSKFDRRPQLTSAMGSGNDTTPTFTWKPVAGAASYQLWVDRSDTYVSGIINVSGLTGSFYTPTTTLPAGEYRVWIRAVSTTGEVSNWSQPVTFSIVVLPAPKFDPAEVGALLASAPLPPQLGSIFVLPKPPSSPGASSNTDPNREDRCGDESSFRMTSPDRGSEHDSASAVRGNPLYRASQFEFIDEVMTEISQPQFRVIRTNDDGTNRQLA